MTELPHGPTCDNCERTSYSMISGLFCGVTYIRCEELPTDQSDCAWWAIATDWLHEQYYEANE